MQKNSITTQLKRFTRPTIIALLTLAFSFLTIRHIHAQTPGALDLTVSPPVIELTAKPGDTVTEKFRVRNNATGAIDLQISVRRLISDPTSGNPTPESIATGEELNWVTFDKNEFTALPKEWQDVSFTIDIPENAAYGYYYVFRITPKDAGSITSTGTAIKGELLIVTLLNVKKEGAISKTELVSFKSTNAINEYLPTNFVARLANKGNVHVKPVGNIYISRGGGKEISILEVNPGAGSILPKGTREFEAQWVDGFLVKEPVIEDGKAKLDKNEKPVYTVKINWNKLTEFRVGPYTARLFMVYNDGNKDVTIEGVTTFWVVPYTAIAIIVVTLIVLILIIRFILKWYIKRAIQNSRR